MHKWETVLAKMASLTPDKLNQWPLACNVIHIPEEFQWRGDVPVCDEIIQFYQLCDGGNFANCAWNVFRCSEVAEKTDHWIDALKDYDYRGAVLFQGQHVVFGDDAYGAPLIWDGSTDAVSTFFPKGGWWEPVAPSMEAFLTDLFNPDPVTSPDWATSVQQIISA